MKLYYGTTSPNVRKVVIAGIACGLEGQIEPDETFPWNAGSTCGGVKPAGKSQH